MQQNEKLKVSNQDENSIFCSSAVHNKMKEILNDFQIPDWILNSSLDTKPRICSYCDKNLSLESIRGINICLNAQHLGDIQVEILCLHCNSSYYLQYRKACSSMNDFINALTGEQPLHKPVLLSDIKPSENNLGEIIIEEHQLKNNQQ
jgi:hypothetical protein